MATYYTGTQRRLVRAHCTHICKLWVHVHAWQQVHKYTVIHKHRYVNGILTHAHRLGHTHTVRLSTHCGHTLIQACIERCTHACMHAHMHARMHTSFTLHLDNPCNSRLQSVFEDHFSCSVISSFHLTEKRQKQHSL